MELARKLFKGDRVIWIIFMLLCFVSAVEVFSATSTLAYKNANHWEPIVRHASFLIAGALTVLVLHNVPYRLFALGILLLPVSILMLVVTPFIGVSANDAHRWLSILGFQVQPSEFAKLGCVIYVAFLLSRIGKFTERQVYRWILIGVGVTCVLILPENFSTAFMLFAICYMLMFVGRISWRRLVKLAGVLTLAMGFFVAIWFAIPDKEWEDLPVVGDAMDRVPTWKSRLITMFAPDNADTLDTDELFNKENYQVSHAKIAIARGGLSPQFPGHGVQRDFLPQAYSDFIYAIIIEEMGLLGGVAVLLLYLWLLVRVGMIARKCDKLFPKFLVLGCGLILVVQALANMAVAVNLIPVTGQPMPLVSRGGTSTVISCVYFGLILSVSRFGAHIGNEDDTLEEPAKVAPGAPAVTEEEIANWVPDVPLETMKESDNQVERKV